MTIKVHVSGKLVWFTAIFPYIVLLVLGIKGWTLPGAANGIKYYLIPDWSRIGDISIWSDAACNLKLFYQSLVINRKIILLTISAQIFFSLTISYGGMTTLASFNRFDANIMRQ